MIDVFLHAIWLLLSDPWIYAFLLIGAALGQVDAAIPGLQGSMAIALLLPVTIYLPLSHSLALLIGIYKGSTYGGAVSAIVLGVPGTAESSMTFIDGFQLAKKGLARSAAEMALGASVTGGFIASTVTLFGTAALAPVALMFRSAEIFAVTTFALVLITVFGGGSVAKSMFSLAFGLLAAMVGADPITGGLRFTFGMVGLQDGFHLIPVLVGVFAMTNAWVEIVRIIKLRRTSENQAPPQHISITEGPPLWWRQYFQHLPDILRGTAAGCFVGFLPGLGATPGAVLSYAIAKRFSRFRRDIGRGSYAGIAAAESGNSSTAGPTLIPLLTFGIPGSGVAALLGGALLLQGVTPSPQLFQSHPDVVWGLLGLLVLAEGASLLVGKVFSRYYATLVQVSPAILFPIVLLLCVIGTYSYRNNAYDVWSLVFFSLAGYAFHIFRIPRIPMVIAFLITSIMESSLRRALLLAGGNVLAIVSRPIVAVFLAGTVLLMFWGIWSARQKRPFDHKRQGEPSDEDIVL